MLRTELSAGWVSDVVPNPSGKNKRHAVHYRILPARAKQRAFRDAKQAEQFRSLLVTQFKALPCGHSAKPFDAAADEFLRLCRKGAGDPVLNERVLRLYIRPLLRQYRLDQINAEIVQMVRRHVIAHNRVKHYQAAILNSFEKSMEAAVAREWLKALPYPQQSRVLPREAKSVAAWRRFAGRKTPSRTTVSLLLNKTTGLLKVVVALALRAGLRVGEILALVWKNIKFDQKRIYITNSAQSDAGPLLDTKTPAGVRWVSMGPKLAALLEEWQAFCIANGAGGAEERIVFRKKSRGPCSRHTINAWLQRFLADNGVGTAYWHETGACRERRYRDTYSIHDLRHACVALWIWQGTLTTDEIRRMIGHENVRTTYDIYGYLILQHEQGASEWPTGQASSATAQQQGGTASIAGHRTIRTFGFEPEKNSRKGSKWWRNPAVKGEKVGRKPKALKANALAS